VTKPNSCLRLGGIRMKGFVDWLQDHALTAVLVLGSAYSVFFVFTHRKELFYKE
jgi:hypothetical protein